MIPGMNKKQMKQMERQMKKMGMKMEDLNGVTEVIIRFEDKELIIDNPSVSLMNVMGQETYQVEGKAREVELDYEVEIPDEDVEMVANQANVSEDVARQALEECKGDLAEAIMKLAQQIIMTIIAHISDLHISDTAFDEEVFMEAVAEINNLKPDMIILTVICQITG